MTDAYDTIGTSIDAWCSLLATNDVSMSRANRRLSMTTPSRDAIAFRLLSSPVIKESKQPTLLKLHCAMGCTVYLTVNAVTSADIVTASVARGSLPRTPFLAVSILIPPTMLAFRFSHHVAINWCCDCPHGKEKCMYCMYMYVHAQVCQLAVLLKQCFQCKLSRSLDT